MDENSPDLKWTLLIGTFVGLVLIILAFVGMAAFLGSLSGELIGFLSMIAGALLANLKEAFGWSFGSSQASQKKDDTISTMATTVKDVSNVASANSISQPPAS